MAFSNRILPPVDTLSGSPELRWHCEPREWSWEKNTACLRLRTDDQTDFWQRTHYGFRADNGHFLYVPVQGEVEFETRVRFQPQHQYDQAGLMVRVSADCWLKASVEFEPEGRDHLGAVVTNLGWSDWSTQEVENLQELILRAEVVQGDCTVHWRKPGDTEWQQLRVAHLHAWKPETSFCIGLYACSPKSGGFESVFDEIRWGAKPQ